MEVRHVFQHPDILKKGHARKRGRRRKNVRRSTTDEETVRDQLKTKRALLFEEFLKNPSKTQLTIEIRLIDDRIGELTRRLTVRSEVRAGLAFGSGLPSLSF